MAPAVPVSRLNYQKDKKYIRRKRNRKKWKELELEGPPNCEGPPHKVT